VNCNRRFKRLDDNESGIEEPRIWGILKEIGVVCQESKESILKKFAKMKERDSKLMESGSYEEGLGPK